MDSYFINSILERTEPLNPSLAKGLAIEHMMGKTETGKSNRLAYIDRLFEISSGMFPEGFKYHEAVICKPEKQVEETTREYGSKRLANIAKSNFRMIALKTSFKGEPCFDRHVLIPFVDNDATMFINGARYSVSPVLADVGYSVLNNTIFIPFRRQKLTFRLCDQHFICNGERKIVHVIWSMIHNEMAKRNKRDLDNRQKIESCLAHYFFSEFGVIGTFKQWANTDVMIGDRKDFPEKDYPRDQWNVYESAKLRKVHPTGDMVLVLPKADETDFVKRLVAGFWYVVDTFPNRFIEIKYADSKALWRIILGLMIFGDFEHQGKITENIDNHLESFNKLLDDMTIVELRHAGVKVNTIWELLHEIMTSLAHHMYDTDVDETSMYNKRPTVLRYVFDEFNYAVTMFAFQFQSRKDKEWTIKDVNDALKRSFKLSTCTGQLTVSHGEIEIVSYPGSNKAIKQSSIIVPQDRAKTNTSHNKSLIGDPSRLIHVSLSDICQFKNQPKNNPDGRGRINLWANIGEDGMVRQREEDAEFLNEVQRKFKR